MSEAVHAREEIQNEDPRQGGCRSGRRCRGSGERWCWSRDCGCWWRAWRSRQMRCRRSRWGRLLRLRGEFERRLRERLRQRHRHTPDESRWRWAETPLLGGLLLALGEPSVSAVPALLELRLGGVEVCLGALGALSAAEACSRVVEKTDVFWRLLRRRRLFGLLARTIGDLGRLAWGGRLRLPRLRLWRTFTISRRSIPDGVEAPC